MVLQDPSTMIIEGICYPLCRIPMFWNVSKCMYTKKTVFRDIGAFAESNTQIETMHEEYENGMHSRVIPERDEMKNGCVFRVR